MSNGRSRGSRKPHTRVGKTNQILIIMKRSFIVFGASALVLGSVVYASNTDTRRATPANLYVVKGAVCTLIQASPNAIFQDGANTTTQLELNSSQGTTYPVFGANNCDISGTPVRVKFD